MPANSDMVKRHTVGVI